MSEINIKIVIPAKAGIQNQVGWDPPTALMIGRPSPPYIFLPWKWIPDRGPV